jgi:ABC-type uncharacterized transport system substrate-binding protein
MRRREFIQLFVSTVVAWPLAARAQQAGAKFHRIGILSAGPIAQRAHLIAAFEEGLQDLGYVGSLSLVFEIRSAEGQPQRLSILARKLASSKVAVILADTTVAVQAAKNAARHYCTAVAPHHRRRGD